MPGNKPLHEEPKEPSQVLKDELWSHQDLYDNAKIGENEFKRLCLQTLLLKATAQEMDWIVAQILEN